MNRIVPIGIGITIIVAGIYLVNLDTEISLQPTGAKIYDVPDGLTSITVSGKLKTFDPPLNAPLSETEPEFILITDKNYPELQGAIQIALYNVKNLPEDLEHAQVTGYFDPKSPDWYYPEQGRTKQVVFVENIIQLEPIDLGNKHTTQELRERYDQLQNEFQDLKDQFVAGKISQERYLLALESLAEHELQLYDDVKEHTFDRDEMTEYNFWYRGVMKFPTAIEQEILKNKKREDHSSSNSSSISRGSSSISRISPV